MSISTQSGSAPTISVRGQLVQSGAVRLVQRIRRPAGCQHRDGEHVLGVRARTCAHASRLRRASDAAEADSCRCRADVDAARSNRAKLEKMLAKACAEMHVPPESVQCDTPTRLGMICNAAAVELGKELVRDEAKLRVDYDLTLREIVRRLMDEQVASH